jgi:hypothetical protein
MNYINTTNGYIELIDNRNNLTELPFNSLNILISENTVSLLINDKVIFSSKDTDLYVNGQNYSISDIETILPQFIMAEGGGGGGDVASVNGKKGDVWLTAQDINTYDTNKLDFELAQKANTSDLSDFYTKSEVYDKDEIDTKIENINIDAVNDSIDEINIDITDIYDQLNDKLTVDNITDGDNIVLTKNGNDIEINVTGVLTEVNWGDIDGDITEQDDLMTQLNSKASTTTVNTINNQVITNTSDIADIKDELANQTHFRGYWSTNAEIQAITKSKGGDYAYSAESGTVWEFNTTWTDSLTPVPDKVIPKTTTIPLMNGTAAIGSEENYAAGNHVHPTDTTRASQNDLTNHTSNLSNPHGVTKSQIGLSNVDNTADLDKPISTQTGQLLNTKADKTTLQTNFYDKSQINSFLESIDIDLANRYTKTESNNLLNNKQNKLTGITDVQVVSALPSSPVSTVLYLIPA